MRLSQLYYLAGIGIALALFSCKNKEKKAVHSPFVFKGLYSFGPDEKSFKECTSGHEYWVADSSAQLELKYTQLISFEKQGDPVYIEVEGKKIPADKKSAAGAYDSTLVVKKLIKITKDIPAGSCK